MVEKCDLPRGTYINAFPFNGSKRLIVVCLPLKWFRKSLESPLKFSHQPSIALEKLLKMFSFIKGIRKNCSNFLSMALKDLESVQKVIKSKC